VGNQFDAPAQEPPQGGTAQVVLPLQGGGPEPEVVVFQAGAEFEIGDLRIQSFTIPHDAADPVGFTVTIGTGLLMPGSPAPSLANGSPTVVPWLPSAPRLALSTDPAFAPTQSLAISRAKALFEAYGRLDDVAARNRAWQDLLAKVPADKARSLATNVELVADTDVGRDGETRAAVG